MSRPTDNNNSPLSLDMIDEDRVRRALGLKTSSGATHQQRPEQARQRHRFVADGAVPVVMLNRIDHETSGLKERLSAAEHALENERAAHTATKRTLQDVSQAHQALQTRFGHTELSHGEAFRNEREARREADDALAALRAEIAGRQPSEAASPEIKPRREIRASEQIRKTRATSAKEPKPIRWWTPSYRTKKI